MHYVVVCSCPSQKKIVAFLLLKLGFASGCTINSRIIYPVVSRRENRRRSDLPVKEIDRGSSHRSISFYGLDLIFSKKISYFFSLLES